MLHYFISTNMCCKMLLYFTSCFTLYLYAPRCCFSLYIYVARCCFSFYLYAYWCCFKQWITVNCSTIPSSLTLTFLRFWNVRFRMDNLSRSVGSCTHSSKNFSESWVSSKESLDVMLKTNMIFSFKIQIKNESIDKLSLIHVYHNTAGSRVSTYEIFCWSSSSLVANCVHLKWAMMSERLCIVTVLWLAIEMYVFSILIEFLSSRTLASCAPPYREINTSSPTKYTS